MISAIQPNFNSYSQKQQVSFGSIHPARFFVKWDDGYYYQATSPDVIKCLKRQIITFLNKDINNSRRGITPPPKPTKAWLRKNALKDRVTKFFTNRDADYAARKEARAFAIDNSNNPECFILTGRHVSITDEEGKAIGRITRESNEKAATLSENMLLTLDEAKKLVKQEYEGFINLAKRDYFANVELEIKRILAIPNSANSPFDAFFVAKKKGDKYIYELVDAKLDGR